jgi:hypothetical protein
MIQNELTSPAAGVVKERKASPLLSRTEYVRRHIYRVPGMLRDPDTSVICALLAWQEKIAAAGNLSEIGVHHGRLFLLLALSRRPDETAVAIDLFEDDGINRGIQAGRDGALLRNARKLNLELSAAEILKGSSMDLTAEDILSRAGGPIRFFSVDGGHMYRHVENDMRLAQQCLSAEGIIAADDFFYLGWPEVSFAVYDFMRSTSDVVPVFATNRKLYLARREFAPQLLDFIRSSPPPGVTVEYPTEMLGNKIALLRISLFSRAKQEIRTRLGR